MSLLLSSFIVLIVVTLSQLLQVSSKRNALSLQDILSKQTNSFACKLAFLGKLQKHLGVDQSTSFPDFTQKTLWSAAQASSGTGTPSWLVSSDTDPTQFSANTSNSLELSPKTTLNSALNAPKVSVEGTQFSFNYAFAILEENTKANYNYRIETPATFPMGPNPSSVTATGVPCST